MRVKENQPQSELAPYSSRSVGSSTERFVYERFNI
jgi:hypothetical protein